jgi:hypothetical protein
MHALNGSPSSQVYKGESLFGEPLAGQGHGSFNVSFVSTSLLARDNLHSGTRRICYVVLRLLVSVLIIQIVAKAAYDCHVTAICSGKNADFVKSLGADEVIDYTSQHINQTLSCRRTATSEYDLIVDCVGGTELLSSYVRMPFL